MLCFLCMGLEQFYFYSVYIVQYRMRLGSAKTVETMFLRLVVALAF